MKENNFKYVLKNIENTSNWIYDVKEYFGDEQTEKFLDYYINKHKIIDKNDIRNMINHSSLSVYSCSNKEQMAFISVYVPFNTEIQSLENIDDGMVKIQKIHRNKSINLSTAIKQLGYSYSTTLCNWKDKNRKDTYQREFVFIVYSEKDNVEEFKNNIIKLAKEFNITSILITDPLINNEPKTKITSKIYDIETGNVLQENTNTTIETVQTYLSNISNAKVLFQVPYEMNKTILYLKTNNIRDYYSKNKQEKIRAIKPQNWNMAMIKGHLLKEFSREDYNS